jgi:hypothetical protein
MGDTLIHILNQVQTQAELTLTQHNQVKKELQELMNHTKGMILTQKLPLTLDLIKEMIPTQEGQEKVLLIQKVIHTHLRIALIKVHTILEKRKVIFQEKGFKTINSFYRT